MANRSLAVPPAVKSTVSVPVSKSAESLSILEELRADQIKAWIQQQPDLDKPLDLVIRDQSIDDAIQQVAQAAGLEMEVISGSINDADRVTHGAANRVHGYEGQDL